MTKTINQDVSAFKDDFFKGLSLRECLYGGGALAVGGRLDLPVVSGKHLRKISNRTALQSADNAVKFVSIRKVDSFENLAKFTADKE